MIRLCRVILYILLVSNRLHLYRVKSSNEKELRLLGLLPMTGDGWSGGTACLPATQMALEDVNANENILINYTLTYNWIDTKCDPGTTVNRMYETLYNDPPYVMVLGAGCSVASEATAQVTHLWNLTQFSYASSSPILSDRKRFPRFYRLALPDQKLNPARIDLMREFNWKKVATLHEAREFFSAVINDFVKRIQNTDVSIIFQEIFMTDPSTRVQNLKNHDARIILTAMYEDKAREVLCAAYKVGLYGPKIVWVFVGWFSATFWKVKLDSIECTEQEMSQAAEGAFLTGPVYSNPVNERGLSNMTAGEFENRFYKHPAYNVNYKSYDFYAHQCYDHVWVAAKALDCTLATMKESGFAKSLDQFTYDDSAINNIIFDCMGHTSLTGVSGRVVFNAEADPNRVVKLERIQDGTRQKVALYRQDDEPNYLKWTEGALRWKDDKIPRDSTLITNVEVGIPLYLYCTMAVLAGLGICVTIFFFVFNIAYRNDRFVKLSSPNINNIFLFGCVFCYSTVFLKTIEVERAAFCTVRIFCFSIGFTVTFGALFAKTWRVYRIFTNKNLQKINIKDCYLLAIVGVLVSVILVVTVLWEIVDPHEIQTKFLIKQVDTMNNDVEVCPYVRMCKSKHSEIFAWVLYISQGGMLSFGAFLAWETKKVQIKALNDSHQIGLCLYNVLVLSVVGLTLSLLLKDQEVLMYGITSGCLILGTTTTQLIIFVPKVRAMSCKSKARNVSISTMTQRSLAISQIDIPHMKTANKDFCNSSSE